MSLTNLFDLRRALVISTVGLFSTLLVACDDSMETEDMSLDTQAERVSYGIALNMGKRMVADNVPLDIDAFTRGLADAASGAEALMTDEEISAEMMAMQEEMQARQQAELDQVANTNLEAGKAYLAENAAKPGIVVTESGLQYEVLEAGSGESPSATSQVEVHYEGRLINGMVFDSSYQRGEPATFGVNQVIPGWTEALQLMSPGAKYQLTIPSDLAYGAGGAGGSIGPNEVLIFDVELLSIQ